MIEAPERLQVYRFREFVCINVFPTAAAAKAGVRCDTVYLRGRQAAALAQALVAGAVDVLSVERHADSEFGPIDIPGVP